MTMSKGSTQRPTDADKFNENFIRIFGDRQKPKEKDELNDETPKRESER